MLLKGLVDEDFVNYKLPSMFIICPSCNFKCDKMHGKNVCQNSALATSPNIEISVKSLVDRYLNNSISKSIVFGGLEPFDSIEDVINFIHLLRDVYLCQDDIVIYTGYTEDEVEEFFENYLDYLKNSSNIIIKYGRFIPNQPSHMDNILGVKLHSDNQYAKKIS